MTAIQVPYLGRPGAMVSLPSPNSPVAASPSKGDTVHALLSGGIAVTTRLHAKKTFSLPYTALASVDADVLLGFYSRLFGLGPFVFVDPSVRNVLGLDVSTCGVRSQASNGWISTSGTVTVDTTTAPPAGVSSGVVKLAGAAGSATLQPGLVANTANTTAAPVYLSAEAVTASVWIKTSTAATMALQLTGYTTAGVVSVTTVSTPVSATTTWTRFTVSAAAGLAALASAAFVLPRIVLGASAPASLFISGAQLEYGTAATAWQPGHGSPRVLPTSSPGREVQQYSDFPSDHTFALGEV